MATIHEPPWLHNDEGKKFLETNEISEVNSRCKDIIGMFNY